MKTKLTNISGWLGLSTWIIGMIFIVFHVAGAPFIILIATIFSQFLFIPLFFFNRNEQLAQYYLKPWVRYVQGICFFIIGFSPLFTFLSWPEAKTLFWAGLGALFVLGSTLYLVRSPKIKRPHIIALLVILAMNFGVTRITKEISLNQNVSNAYPIYIQLVQQRNQLKKELSVLTNDSLEIDASGDSLVKLIDNIKVAILSRVDNLPTSIADSLNQSNALPERFSNTDIPTQILIGPNLNSPYPDDKPLSALQLKKHWRIFSENRLVHYHDSLGRTPSFSYDGYNRHGEIVAWEATEFYHLTSGLIFTRLELYKIFVYTELVIDAMMRRGQNIPELFKLKREFFFDLYNTELTQALEGYRQSSENRASFFIMMLLSCFLTIILFFVPTWKTTDSWKIRMLLFNLVIIFEFILLLTDYYLGTFSQNPLYLLMANILLAFGLVALDNFLRNNFLKWYEREE